MRARPWLALSLLGVSSLSWGATLEGAPRVRTSLDDEVAVALRAPTPRRIRGSLDEVVSAVLSPRATSSAAYLEDAPLIRPPLPRRVHRISRDEGQPTHGGRLIRLSLDEGSAVYGRLRDIPRLGRQMRTSLD